MKKKILLVAMDVDGTILGKGKSISQRTKKVFAAAAKKKVHMVIATGRAAEAIPAEIQEMKGVEYIITSNGSSIFKLSDGSRIYGQDLPAGQIRQLMAFYEGWDCPIEVFVRGKAYTSSDYFKEPEKFGADSESADYVRRTRHPEADICQFVSDHEMEIEGINFIVYDEVMKQQMREGLEAFNDFYVTSSVRRYIEISHRDVCKATALEWLCQELGVSREETAAFGDGENDIEMIQYAGLGVAMENGVPAAKVRADLIAPPCDEDGVARVLEERVLEV